jgi:hypothetical protein
LTVTAIDQAIRSLSSVKIANGIYWAALPLLSSVNGLLAVRALRRSESTSVLILPILAAFYSLVSLFMQNAIYLYFTAGLTLTAVLWMVACSRLPIRGFWAGLAVLMTVIAVGNHAAQPYTRTPVEMLEGRRPSTLPRDCALPRCGLQLDPVQVERYRQIVAIIQNEVAPGATIAVFPSDAQLYFLSDRRNPFRFYNSAIGLRSPADVEETLAIMQREAPRIMTFRPGDKYTTPATRTIVARVRPQYDHIATVDGIEVHRLKGPAANARGEVGRWRRGGGEPGESSVRRLKGEQSEAAEIVVERRHQ